jgi:Tfp pilus assembly protein PilX
MRHRRGFLLVFGLLVMVLLLILGLGFLGKQADAYRSATQAAAASVAMECAMAGLEDARVKLTKDLQFPPPGDVEQLRFAYTEILNELDGATPIGSYTVTVDSHWAPPPVEILVIEVVGVAGDPADEASARRRLTVEYDLAERRSGSANPNLGRFINFQDHGSL